HNLCAGQCWYDELVHTPAGHPDIVYVGGSYIYGEQYSNKRGLVLSTDAGVTSTDMTMDATDPLHPNGLHPDQHALVTNPTDPFQFFEVNDGGVMRSSGAFANVSSWCDGRNMNVPATDDPALRAARLARCRQLLSRVPTGLTSLNKGLSTLQFQSLSVSPFNVNILQGGTQDNGTWQTLGNPVKWQNTMIGDGGQSGFDAADAAFRFHTFFNATPDVNFSDGEMADWNWIADQIFFGGEPQAFYVPIISDPVVTRSMFAGLGHVWRTKTWGMGALDRAAFRQRCNEWFGVFDNFCGDWEPLGATTYVPQAFPFLPNPNSYAATRLTASGALYGMDRAGGFVAAVERATTDTATLWAATSTGRVFISTNADAPSAAAVTFRRLDSLAANDPGRFVSGIHIDPANVNRAFVSYSGFSASTPTTPGHVFEVTYNPATDAATWVDRSYDFDDIPVTDIARDDVVGDLYAATDFGVFRLLAGTTQWVNAAPGMPNVEVAGLTIVPAERKLYAATHGLGAWLLNLP
ncbi:MAG: exo-alpha-sialidase, partial [Vicinamibacterales bacterium]